MAGDAPRPQLGGVLGRAPRRGRVAPAPGVLADLPLAERARLGRGGIYGRHAPARALDRRTSSPPLSSLAGDAKPRTTRARDRAALDGRTGGRTCSASSPRRTQSSATALK